jgi:uncharacterized phage-associated protein
VCGLAALANRAWADAAVKRQKRPLGACRFQFCLVPAMVLVRDSVIRAEWHLARVSPLWPCQQALIREIIHGSGPFVMSDYLPSLPPATHDPRSICNLILDEADKTKRAITNLALQKLLYFAHGLHLVETKNPLVTGFFEAWQFGPVHPIAYRAFKSAGANPIQSRATIQDPFTHSVRSVAECTDLAVKARVRRIVTMYVDMTPGRLIEISHAKGAPWQFIVDKARTETILGLRIPNDVIASRFKYHKVSIGSEPRHGEPREEAPFI